MPRYYIFTGENYYPGGGAWDFWTTANTREEAEREAWAAPGDWANILDTETKLMFDTSWHEHGWREPSNPKKEE